MPKSVQLVGAVLVLAAFVLAQLGRLDPRGVRYLTANLAGSAALALDALVGREWGFLLLEGAWALVSAWSLVTTSRLATALRPAAASSAGRRSGGRGGTS